MFLPGSLSLFWEAATFFLSPRGTFHHNLKRPMCTCVSAKTNTLTFLSLLPYVFFFLSHVLIALMASLLLLTLFALPFPSVCVRRAWLAPHVRVPLCLLFFRKLLDFSPLFIISTVQVVFSFFSTIATKSEMIYVTPNRFCKPQGLLRWSSLAIPGSRLFTLISALYEENVQEDD